MLTKVFGSSVFGIHAEIVTVEVYIDKGIGYHLVGLPDNAVKESGHRIDSALQNNGYRLPGKKITINMAPADQRKEGAAYDLTIAIGILSASAQIDSQRLSDSLIMGELSLDGTLQPIKGALPIAIEARSKGFKRIILPQQNADEAAIVNNLEVYGASNLKQVIGFLEGNQHVLDPIVFDTRSLFQKQQDEFIVDFSDIRGQEFVKRGMEIAAAGGHNLILIGPPGCGKTMIAKRIPTILPPMTTSEALETTKIHSVVGSLKGGTGLVSQRPFRSPHHTISDVALVGGGTYPQPGEISMAHNGVLFLDELPEFKRSVLEVLRQPLEDRAINISRAKFTISYPASFMLVASMNPSPSGYFNHSDSPMTSTPAEMKHYLSKISGPLLDRIDLHIEVSPVPFKDLSERRKGESSAVIRQRVTEARELQTERFKNFNYIHYNSQMDPKHMETFCQIDQSSQTLLQSAMDKINCSARSYNRILKVARTIADLDYSETIQQPHILEAIQYRNLDKNQWLDF